MSNKAEMNEKLKSVLNDVVSSIVKEENGAICSSLTHLNMAVVKLLLLIDDFEAKGDEANAVLFAIGECGSNINKDA